MSEDKSLEIAILKSVLWIHVILCLIIALPLP